MKSGKYVNTRSYLWCLKNSLIDISLRVEVEKRELGTQTWVSILDPSNSCFMKLGHALNLFVSACSSTVQGYCYSVVEQFLEEMRKMVASNYGVWCIVGDQ